MQVNGPKRTSTSTRFLKPRILNLVIKFSHALPYSDSFHQVFGLVYGASSADGYAVRQQLQRHDFEDT
jgi:hypothetical protein